MKLKLWVDMERGRATQLARHVGVSQPTVSDWSAGKKQVPLDHCPEIQAFTDGQVTCEELRPDKVEYFALIRAQATAMPAASAERRDPNRANPFPDLNCRRATDVLAGES